VRSTPEQLLADLVGRWTRGEPLEVEALLERAGPQSDELAMLIDAFLERAPRREPTQDAVAFVRALDEPQPPLLRARQARCLKLDDIAAALVDRLGLPDGARVKVRRHYQALELGQLDPAGVAATVWAALAIILGRDAQSLAAAPAPVVAAPAMYRDAGTLERALTDYSLGRRTEPVEQDEADRLFGVAPADDG
jgi:hypothetical protein